MQVTGRITIDAWDVDAQVKRCRITEALSAITDMRVELEHGDPNLDLSAAMWSGATLRFVDDEGTVVRAFHGVVEEASFIGVQSQAFRYVLRVRPRMHCLAQRFGSRIYQDKTVQEIVTDVLTRAGIDAASQSWNLSLTYLPREYCVQYKETDLAFVLRLLEDEGIFYWFEHEEGAHTLCFADGPSAQKPVEGDALFSFAESAAAGDQTMSQLRLSTRRVHSGYRTRDWNWQSPAQPVEGEQQDTEGKALLHYEFPGGVDSSIAAARVASDRRQALALRKHLLTGASSNGHLMPGRTFSVQNAAPAYIDGEYLLLSVEHHYEDASERTQANIAPPNGPNQNAPRANQNQNLRRPWAYRAQYEAVPQAVGFRPLRVTPRPVITGTEVATISGPAGEEIHVDHHGRVKLHFYWDREHADDGGSSCWVRVQQQNTHGSMLLPRVGWEVAVAFMFGDPDRPIVLDKRYNAATLPPYELPGNLSQAALETMSTGGGGGMSGVRMQDTAGGQGFFVTAQRDLEWTAGHDQSEKVTLDAKATIGANCSTQVGGAEDVIVGSNQKIKVTGTATFNTGGSKNISIDGREHLSTGHNRAFTCDGSRTETIGSAMIALCNNVDESFNADNTRTIGAALVMTTPSGSLVEAVGGSKTELIGAAKVEIVTGDHSETVGESKALTAGAATYKAGSAFDLAVKGKLNISASKWTEKCGGDFGFSGKTVLVDAKDGLKSSAGGTKLNIKGGKIEIDGSGFGAKGGPKLEMKGKINFKS